MDVEMAVVDVDVPAEDVPDERQDRRVVDQVEEGVVVSSRLRSTWRSTAAGAVQVQKDLERNRRPVPLESLR